MSFWSDVGGLFHLLVTFHLMLVFLILFSHASVVLLVSALTTNIKANFFSPFLEVCLSSLSDLAKLVS